MFSTYSNTNSTCSSQLATWFNPDPMMEKYHNYTPYNYCFNNPITFVDPTGLDPLYGEAAQNLFRWMQANSGAGISEIDRVAEGIRIVYGPGGCEGLSMANRMGKVFANAGINLQGVIFEFDGTSFVISTQNKLFSVVEETGTIGDKAKVKAQATGDDFGWNDVANNAFNVVNEAGSSSKAILENRGKYMPRGRIYKINKPVTVRTPIVNINTTSKVLNVTRVAGKVCFVAGVVTTGISVFDDIDNGNYYSAGTRTAVYGVAAGAAFIPVVGWGVSIGIGVADTIWGDQFYEWVEIKMGD